MNVTTIPKEQIEADWDRIAWALLGAVRHSPGYDLNNLYTRLMNGSALLFKVSDGASGYWAVSIDDDGSAWTVAIAGKIDGGPKQRLETIRYAVKALEASLVNIGVTVHRICGRDWSAILTDYRPYSGVVNGLEKEL